MALFQELVNGGGHPRQSPAEAAAGAAATRGRGGASRNRRELTVCLGATFHCPRKAFHLGVSSPLSSPAPGGGAVTSPVLQLGTVFAQFPSWKVVGWEGNPDAAYPKEGYHPALASQSPCLPPPPTVILSQADEAWGHEDDLAGLAVGQLWFFASFCSLSPSPRGPFPISPSFPSTPAQGLMGGGGTHGRIFNRLYFLEQF